MKFVHILGIILFIGSKALFAGEIYHPGGILNQEEIQLMRTRVASRDPLWVRAGEKVFTRASLSYSPLALPYLYTGGEGKCYHFEYGVWAPKAGCKHQHQAIQYDGEQCMAHAMAYLLSGKEAYAKKSIEIMKAWNRNCIYIYSRPELPNGKVIVPGREGSNAALELGWLLSDLLQAAELLKFSYDGWRQSGAEKELLNFCNRATPHMEYPFIIWKKFNNWHGTILEARMLLAILKDDKNDFNYQCSRFENLMIKQGIFPDGMTADTKRDAWHAQAFFAGLLQCSETAYHQGIDVYKLDNNKILFAMETNAAYGLKNKWDFVPVWEIGYNHFVNRKGIKAPNTEAFIKAHEAMAHPDDFQFHWGWEFLTHYNTTEAYPKMPSR